MNRRTIRAYRINDHGISRYPPVRGKGRDFTDYVLGHGVNYADAMEDALQQLNAQRIDTITAEVRMMQDEGVTHWPNKPQVVSDGSWYFVSIDFDLDPTA